MEALLAAEKEMVHLDNMIRFAWTVLRRRMHFAYGKRYVKYELLMFIISIIQESAMYNCSVHR